MKRKPSFGLNLAGFDPPLETARLSRKAEENEFDYVWIADENPSPMCRDVVVNVTATAIKTSRIKIGTGICNFYTRHPALLAEFVASVDEISPGRIVLGVGPGGDMPLRPLGIKMWDKPLTTVREGIEVVNRLLSGEKVNFEGEMIRTRGAKLAFLPKTRIPIYLAARSPRLMQMIGEILSSA
jgi:5,10-methylenetetrahydromethanopterin reductase